MKHFVGFTNKKWQHAARGAAASCGVPIELFRAEGHYGVAYPHTKVARALIIGVVQTVCSASKRERGGYVFWGSDPRAKR